MALSGSQSRKISAALLAAFDVDGLRALTRYELDIDLDSIGAGDLEARVFALVDYAERSGRVADLVQGAARQNPGNEQLRALVGEAIAVSYTPKKTLGPVATVRGV